MDTSRTKLLHLPDSSSGSYPFWHDSGPWFSNFLDVSLENVQICNLLDNGHKRIAFCHVLDAFHQCGHEFVEYWAYGSHSEDTFYAFQQHV